MGNDCGRTVGKCVGLVIGFGRRMNWPCSWSCVKVGREVGIRERFSVGHVVGLVRVVQFGKIIGHVVGFGVFVGHRVGNFARFCNFVGHRSENDHEKASVGRVVGSEFDRSEQKKGKIRREKLVVRFDSFYVTDENTNYLSAVI